MSDLFENDIFISYAHIDNQALVEGEPGWISNFHHALEIRLRQLLGAEARIWRDAKLQGNDYFGDALVNQFPRVALLMSILSPRYLQSEWCLREFEEFCNAAQKNLGVQLGDRSRIFTVVKTQVPLERQPSEMQGMLGYEFYQVDPASGRAREFNQEAGANKDRRYWDKLEDLAYDIAELLKVIETQQLATQKVTPTKKSIYLAPTTSDLKEEYDIVRREFLQRGHSVLPEKPLPQCATEIQAAVQEYLARCAISVHLIGRHYGLIPEAAERSIVELQNAIAADRCLEDPVFARLIWLPVGLDTQESRQREFIRYLETDSAAQRGAELLRTDLGELKAAMQNLLSNEHQDTTSLPEEEDEPPQVYVIYSGTDFDAAAPVEDYLYEAGCELLSPLIEGEGEQEIEDLEEHQDNLLHCDAAIIFYGNASDRWFRTKLRDLNDAHTQRSQPLSVKAVYLAPPESRQKQRFQTHKAMVVKGSDRFIAEDLAPFVAAVKQSRSKRV